MRGVDAHQVSNLDMKRFQRPLLINKKEDSIFYSFSGLFESDNFVYRVVFMQLPNTIWYLKAPFIKMILENVFKGSINGVPYWVTSLREIFVRKATTRSKPVRQDKEE